MQLALVAEIQVGNVKLSKGDQAVAEALMGLFDKFDPSKNVTIHGLHD